MDLPPAHRCRRHWRFRSNAPTRRCHVAAIAADQTSGATITAGAAQKLAQIPEAAAQIAMAQNRRPSQTGKQPHSARGGRMACFRRSFLDRHPSLMSQELHHRKFIFAQTPFQSDSPLPGRSVRDHSLDGPGESPRQNQSRLRHRESHQLRHREGPSVRQRVRRASENLRRSGQRRTLGQLVWL